MGDKDQGRWSFIRHRRSDETATWLWQRFGRDGKLQRTSAEFSSYGAALRNALEQGFLPTADDYSVDLPAGRLHFPPGRDPEFASSPERCQATPVKQANGQPNAEEPQKC